MQSVLVHNDNGCFNPAAKAEGLPKWEQGGTTYGSASGRTASGDAVDYDLLWSSDKVNHSSLIDDVNDKVGVLRGSSRSSRASDLKQKNFAALMNREGIVEADVVINNPHGPCRQPLGCDQIFLDFFILDPGRGLTGTILIMIISGNGPIMERGGEGGFIPR